MTDKHGHIPTNLALEVGDDQAPEQFMAAARAFFGYVQEIGRMVAPEGTTLQWVVRVREGSAVLAVDPAPSSPVEFAEFAYARAERGLRRVASGDIDDSGLSESALGYLKALSELTDGRDGHARPIKMWVKYTPIDVSADVARVIREDWRTDYRDYGTVEGRLETIQDKNGSLQLQVRDAMLQRTVRCYFTEDKLPDAFAKFRKRVEIAGQIHYRKNGTPVSIEVTKIESLPDDSELPSALDVRGILRVSA